MPATDYAFDAETIAAAIARWARIESPSFDATAVNAAMDLAQSTMQELGARITRYPGRQGYADIHP